MKNFVIFFFLLNCSLMNTNAQTIQDWGGYKKSIENEIQKQNFSEAEQLLEKAQKWFEEKQFTETKEFAELLLTTGECNFQTYQLEKASLYYREGLKKFKPFKKTFTDELTFAYNAANLAQVFAQQGIFEEAKMLLDKSLSQLRNTIKEAKVQKVVLDTIPFVGLLLKSYGDVYFAEDNLALAEKYYFQAKDLLSKDKSNAPQRLILFGKIYRSLAEMYERQGQEEKSLQYLQQIHNFYKAIFGNDVAKISEYILVLKDLGELYVKQKNYDTAAEHLYEALQIQKDINENNAVYAEIVLATARYQLFSKPNEATKALHFAKLAYVLFDKNYKYDHIKHIESANLAGFIALFLKNYAEAEKYFSLALKRTSCLGNPQHIYFIALNYNAGLAAMRQNKNEEALFYFLEGNRAIRKQILKNFAHLTEKEKDALYKTFNENITLFAYFISTIVEKVPYSAEFLFELLLDTKAFLFSQNRMFVKSLQTSKDATIKKQYQRWLEKKKQLAHLQQQTILSEKISYQGEVKALENEIETLEKSLATANNSFKAKLEKSKEKTWIDIQQKLKPDEALVEIVRTYSFRSGFWQDSAIYLALVIHPNSKSVQTLILPKGYEMENEDIHFYRNCIRSRKIDKESYNVFWKKIANEIKQYSHIYFVADGIYHQINLITLFNPETQKYLLEEKKISLLSRSADLLEIKNRQQRSQNFRAYQAYLFGYPDYSYSEEKMKAEPKGKVDKRFEKQRFFELGSGKVSTLPGTKTEIENISKILNQVQIKASIFLAKEASENNLKDIDSEMPNLLHIATHGFFIDESTQLPPLQKSGLLLAGAEISLQKQETAGTENGILTAEEVLGLDLEQTELVALSACETGLGEIRNGEGVYGLQRAFLQAGAKGVLASLWKVDDAATQAFMTKFYENWLQKKMPKTEAILATQKAIKTIYKEPYYWGAFVLIGSE